MVGLGGGMRSVKLREWRGVNKVAGPSGAAITTRRGKRFRKAVASIPTRGVP